MHTSGWSRLAALEQQMAVVTGHIETLMSQSEHHHMVGQQAQRMLSLLADQMQNTGWVVQAAATAARGWDRASMHYG